MVKNNARPTFINVITILLLLLEIDVRKNLKLLLLERMNSVFYNGVFMGSFLIYSILLFFVCHKKLFYFDSFCCEQ